MVRERERWRKRKQQQSATECLTEMVLSSAAQAKNGKHRATTTEDVKHFFMMMLYGRCSVDD